LASDDQRTPYNFECKKEKGRKRPAPNPENGGKKGEERIVTIIKKRKDNLNEDGRIIQKRAIAERGKGGVHLRIYGL